MKLMLVCSHGGHLTEMERLLPALGEHDLLWVTYAEGREPSPGRTHRIDRLGLNPLRYAGALVQAIGLLGRERPDVLISTGSEIAIPFFLAARLLGIRTIFVESLCRVKTRSGTALVLYPVASEFYVQWPEQLELYGKKAQFRGSVL